MIHVLVAVGLLTSVLQEVLQNKSAMLCTCYSLILKSCTYHWYHVTAWKCQHNKQLQNTEWKYGMELVFLWGVKASYHWWFFVIPTLTHRGVCRSEVIVLLSELSSARWFWTQCLHGSVVMPDWTTHQSSSSFLSKYFSVACDLLSSTGFFPCRCLNNLV